MLSVSYDDIYSRFLSIVEAHDLLALIKIKQEENQPEPESEPESDSDIVTPPADDNGSNISLTDELGDNAESSTTDTESEISGEIDDSDAKRMMNEWLKSVRANPRVRKVFSTCALNADEEILSFELKNSVDDEYDIEFVIEIFALGVAWKWALPKYQSVLNTAQFFGGKEQSWYSQANHMAELKKLCDSAQLSLYKTISDHGCYNNSYIGGV